MHPRNKSRHIHGEMETTGVDMRFREIVYSEREEHGSRLLVDSF